MANKNFGVDKITFTGSGVPSFTSPNDFKINAITVGISTHLRIGGQVVSNVVVGTGYSVGIGVTNPRYTVEVGSRVGTSSTILSVNGNSLLRDLHVTGVSTVGGSVSVGSTLTVGASVSVGSSLTAQTVYGTSFTDSSYAASGRWTLVATGTTSYAFAGIGFTTTAWNPIIYLARGRRYQFVNGSSGNFPLVIRRSNSGATYLGGVTGSGTTNGVLTFDVPFNAPNSLYYQCSSIAGMGNTIVIYPSTI
jgi:hypothetical protein